MDSNDICPLEQSVTVDERIVLLLFGLLLVSLIVLLILKSITIARRIKGDINLQTLNNRLIIGEISQNEYEILREIISNE